GAAAGREGRQRDAAGAAGRARCRRPCHPRARAVGARSQPGRAEPRSGQRPRRQTGVRRRARRRGDRGNVLGLPRGRRHSVRVPRGAERRRAEAGAARQRDQGESARRPNAVHASGVLSARLLLSCGEASGDLYAGALVRQLRAIDPGIDVFGLGGPQLAAAGGRLVVDYRGLAATGLTEVLPKLGEYFAAMRALVAAAERERPAALVAIDFPDFNFRLARRVKRLGIPVIYYISPQIWAWRRGRLKTIRAFADRVLVIFPFEEAIYREGGVPAEFVGHPLVELSAVSAPRAEFLRAHGLSPGAPTVAILPGSRANEVSRILPDLLAAADRIRAAVPAVQFVVARAPHLDDAVFAEAAADAGAAHAVVGPARRWTTVAGDTDTVLASAD